MKTYRIKLGNLRKLIREIYGGGSAGPGESTGRSMAETDVGVTWPHPWPKPKNSTIMAAHKAVVDYIEPDQAQEMVDGKYVIDPHFPGVVAVRFTDGPTYGNTTMDFVVYNCEGGGCGPDDVEEVTFKSWPPGKSGGYR